MSHFGNGVVKDWFYTGGGERLGWWTSGVVNVWGGECLGGERLTIADVLFNSLFLFQRFCPWHNASLLWNWQYFKVWYWHRKKCGACKNNQQLKMPNLVFAVMWDYLWWNRMLSKYWFNIILNIASKIEASFKGRSLPLGRPRLELNQVALVNQFKNLNKQGGLL